MIPHERTRLTYAEQQTLLEMERHLERLPDDPPTPRSWVWQVAGVVIVAVSALLVGGLTTPARGYPSVVVEGVVGIVGLLVGAALAIDPLRRWVRSIPPAISIAGWRRRRLARRLERPDRVGFRLRLRRSDR